MEEGLRMLAMNPREAFLLVQRERDAQRRAMLWKAHIKAVAAPFRRWIRAPHIVLQLQTQPWGAWTWEEILYAERSGERMFGALVRAVEALPLSEGARAAGDVGTRLQALCDAASSAATMGDYIAAMRSCPPPPVWMFTTRWIRKKKGGYALNILPCAGECAWASRAHSLLGVMLMHDRREMPKELYEWDDIVEREGRLEIDAESAMVRRKDAAGN